MHVRITKQGLWLLRHRELASSVINAIHDRHADFISGKDIKVDSPQGDSVTITIASKVEETEKAEKKKD